MRVEPVYVQGWLSATPRQQVSIVSQKEKIMTTILGIDIASEKFDVHLQREGQQPEPATFENTKKGFGQLQRFLKKRQAQDAHVCMEATGVYYEELAHFLHEKGYAVSVVNPLQIKAYARSQLRRNKTDRLDAEVIADFCGSQNPPLWSPPDPVYYELRGLVRHLEDLESDRQRQRNRLHAYKRSAHAPATILKDLRTQIQFLSRQITSVKQQIQALINKHPALKEQCCLLASIVGIGQLSAAKLMAEYGDMTLFGGVRQVVAFAGLNPRQRQSGSSIRGKTNISKMGRSSIRAALYMPAMSAIQHNTLLQPLITRLREDGLCEMEIIVAVMRKLLHLAFGVLKTGQPFDPHYLEKEVAIA